LRGHGLSDKLSTGYDLPRLIEDLETALILLKGKGKFVLMGHSFGGAMMGYWKDPKATKEVLTEAGC